MTHIDTPLGETRLKRQAGADTQVILAVVGRNREGVARHGRTNLQRNKQVREDAPVQCQVNLMAQIRAILSRLRVKNIRKRNKRIACFIYGYELTKKSKDQMAEGLISSIHSAF